VATVSAAAVVVGMLASAVALPAAAGTDFGGAYGWGFNGNGFHGPGAVGDETNIKRPTPVPLGALPDNVKQVSRGSGGSGYGIALMTNGSLYAWGDNGFGVLGTGTRPDGSTISTNFPQPVPLQARIIQVSAGRAHVLAVADDGAVWAWGYNGSGALGDGTTEWKFSPERLSGLPPIVQVAAGGGHSLALAANGTVWAWGSNGQGQLGNGRNTLASTRPVQVPGLFNVIQVAAGDAHSLALTSGGMVWAWGENTFGRLGDGTTQDRSSPVPVLNQHRNLFIGVKWISAGDDHNLAVAGLDSSVWAWGSNHCTDCFGPPAGQGGQLGDGSTTDRPLATHIGLPGTVQVSAARELSAALRSDGKVFGWGVNQGVRVGTGSIDNFIRTPALLPLSNVVQISIGVYGGAAVVVPNVVVPDVRGYDVSGAAQVLTSSGLTVGTVTDVTNCNNIGLVVSSTPGAGTLLRRRSAVNLSVGQPPQPPKRCD
jgi:alpha-tubulin suppressor-like RCC1 family protein